MKRIFSLFLLFFLTINLVANADVITQPGGQGPTGMTCVLNAIPAASTKVTLTAPSSYITIVNASATATLYFSPVSPATTSNFPIVPNAAYSYAGVPLSSFWVIGDTAGDHYGVIAH